MSVYLPSSRTKLQKCGHVKIRGLTRRRHTLKTKRGEGKGAIWATNFFVPSRYLLRKLLFFPWQLLPLAGTEGGAEGERPGLCHCMYVCVGGQLRSKGKRSKIQKYLTIGLGRTVGILLFPTLSSFSPRNCVQTPLTMANV